MSESLKIKYRTTGNRTNIFTKSPDLGLYDECIPSETLTETLRSKDRVYYTLYAMAANGKFVNLPLLEAAHFEDTVLEDGDLYSVREYIRSLDK